MCVLGDVKNNCFVISHLILAGYFEEPDDLYQDLHLIR